MTTDNEFHHDDEHKAAEGDWISNEPPVDDFGDPSSEAATVSEDSEHVQEEMVEQIAEPKKKSPLFVVLGIVGALVVAGGFGYWHFSGHNEDESSLLDMASQDTSSAPAPHFDSKPAAKVDAAPVAAAPTATAEVAPKTSYSAPSSNPEPTKTAAQPVEAVAPSPAAEAPAAPVSAMVAEKIMAEPVVQPSAPVQAPVVAPAAVAVAPVPVAQATVSKADTAAADARIAALQSRIDDLQKSLSQTTQQLEQMNTKLASNATSAAIPIVSDTSSEDRINKLEQKLIQLEQHQATPSATPSSISLTDDVNSRPVKKSKHVDASKVTHHKVAHVAAKAKAKAKETPKDQWVLRAATPDEAWVAKDANTRELRPVHVGDELAGIGKITAIKQAGDGWVLKGTKGSIR